MADQSEPLISKADQSELLITKADQSADVIWLNSVTYDERRDVSNLQCNIVNYL